MIKIPQNLLLKTATAKLTKYIQLSKTDGNKNNLLVKEALKNLEINSTQKQTIESLIADPNSNSTLALFCEDKTITSIFSLPYDYEFQYEGDRYYIVPLNDYRIKLLNNLFLLRFSVKQVDLFNVGQNNLKRIPLDNIETFEHKLDLRIEDKSIQVHGGKTPIYTGQNATTERDRYTMLLEDYVKEISQLIQSKLNKDSVLMVAADRQHTDIVKRCTNNISVTDFNLEGNYDNESESSLYQKLTTLISSHEEEILKLLGQDLSMQESERYQSKKYNELLKEVEKGRIEKNGNWFLARGRS